MSTRELMYAIADRMGKRRADMEQFITIFQQNWFNNSESLKTLRPADYEKYRIPAGLANIIMERLGVKQETSMDIESPVEDSLRALKRKVSSETFADMVSTLLRIFTNIRENLMQQKYKTLKRSNQKIAALLSYPEIVSVLNHGGFQQGKFTFEMVNVNISLIDETINSISKCNPNQPKFNPYEQNITSMGDTNAKTYEGESSMIYNQKLLELEKERERLMSRPVKDREVKIFQMQTVTRTRMDQEFNEEKEANQEERIYMNQMKEILKKQTEDPKFMNRRKQEYFDLVKKPCFTETIVRVKMPDDWIFECKFAPLETLQSLINAFEELLENKSINYYLYMTPPVQKLTGIVLRKTFYELGCVPRAIFYFSSEPKVKGNIFKKKKSFF